MTEPGRPTLVEQAFHRFEARQSLFFDKLSATAKMKLAGVGSRFAELAVTGPEGGKFYFAFRGRQFEFLKEKPHLPDSQIDKMSLDGDGMNYKAGDDVFFDIIDGELSPRAAVSRQLFKVQSDRIIYDTEEVSQAFEGFLEDMSAILGRRG